MKFFVIASKCDFVKSCKFVAIQKKPPPLRRTLPFVPHSLARGGFILLPPPLARGGLEVGFFVILRFLQKTEISQGVYSSLRAKMSVSEFLRGNLFFVILKMLVILKL